MNTIDTVVVAAAGRGTRMKELSEDKPKHLIEVAGKPFLHHILQRLEDAAFKRIILVVGYRSEQVEKFVESSPFDVEIVNQHDQVGDKYGTAAVVESVKDVMGKEPFVYMNGDNIYPMDVLQAVQKNDGYNHIVCMHHDHPEKYGVLEVDVDGLVEYIVEKPADPPSTLINLGLYVFQPKVFSIVKKLRPSQRGEYEITDAIAILAQDHEVKATEVSRGAWLDFGRPEDIPVVGKHLEQ